MDYFEYLNSKTIKMEPPLVAQLKKQKIKYPGSDQPKTLHDLHTSWELLKKLKMEYPNIGRRIQYLPELRGEEFPLSPEQMDTLHYGGKKNTKVINSYSMYIYLFSYLIYYY